MRAPALPAQLITQRNQAEATRFLVGSDSL